MLIQIDIDSTLYDSGSLFDSIAQEFKIKNWPKDTRTYKWFNPYDIGVDLKDLNSVFRRAHSREHVIQNIPYTDAVEVLRGIAHDFEDVELAYISDRNEQQGTALRDWLEQEGFLSDENEHVAVTKDKRHWMRENRPEIVIDDRVRTMLMARYELGAQVISLEHTHNSNLIGEADGIYIVPTWLDIDDVLRKIIIPEIQNKKLSRV
jgi:hypothetical protein